MYYECRNVICDHQSIHFYETPVCFNLYFLGFICEFHWKMTEKIGEGALVAIKKQNAAIAEFKIPTVPKAKKLQMEILTEEQYIEVRTIATDHITEYEPNPSINSPFEQSTGNGQNYSKRFFPGFGEIASTKSIFGRTTEE